MLSHRFVPISLFVVVLLSVQSAFACGAFFQQDVDSTAAMNAQQALYVVRADRVELTIRVAAETVDSNLTWVVPVPAIDDVRLGDPALFDALDELTKPQITITDFSGGNSGACMPCPTMGAADAGGGMQGGTNASVQHLNGGQVGNYEYDILAATDAAAMVSWLTDAGYVVPEGTADVLAPYVANGLQFLWAKINTDALDDDALILDPLQLDIPYTGPPVLSYPLALSALSASPITSVLLYTLANERFQVSNMDNQDLEVVAAAVKTQWDYEGITDLEAAVDTLTAEAGGHLAITDFSMDLPAFPRAELEMFSPIIDLVDDQAHILTRLHLRVPVLALTDLMLSPVPDGQAVHNHQYARQQPRPLYLAHMGFFFLTLFGFRAFMRRRFGGASRSSV